MIKDRQAAHAVQNNMSSLSEETGRKSVAHFVGQNRKQHDEDPQEVFDDGQGPSEQGRDHPEHGMNPDRDAKQAEADIQSAGWGFEEQFPSSPLSHILHSSTLLLWASNARGKIFRMKILVIGATRGIGLQWNRGGRQP